MNKKQASLIAFISMSLFLLLSFMPIIFNMSSWTAETPGVGIYTKLYYVDVNIFSRNFWLASLVMIFCIIGIVSLIMLFADKKAKFIKYGTFAPIITAVLFVSLSVSYMISPDYYGEPQGTATLGVGYFSYAPDWGFYIECALLIVACVLSILLVTGKVTNDKGSDVLKEAEPVDVAGELKKYKELLDLGAITEQEYEKKKKQLLDF